MKILICGSRDWTDERLIRRTLRGLLSRYGTFDLVSGGARGADRLAASLARSMGLATTEVFADWRGNGRRAGPERNRKMLELGPILVVAFKDRFRLDLATGGTENMAKIALSAGIPVRLIYHHGESYGAIWLGEAGNEIPAMQA